MSFGNRTHETSATTGTGNITLAGAVSGFTTFSATFEIGCPFTYFIDNEAGLWETGIGHLSASTTLVRDYVKDNSSGGTSAISFTGTLQVLNVGSAQNANPFTRPVTAVFGSGVFDIYYPPMLGNYSTFYTARNNRLMYYPFMNNSGELFAEWAVYVKTISAGEVMRMAIYLIDETTGLPTGTPYMESDDIDMGSAGVATSPFTANTVGPTTANQRLPDRFFLAICMEGSTAKIASTTYTQVNLSKSWCGVNSNGAAIVPYQAFTLGTPTPGASALPTVGALVAGTENQMIGGFGK